MVDGSFCVGPSVGFVLPDDDFVGSGLAVGCWLVPALEQAASDKIMIAATAILRIFEILFFISTTS